MSGTFVQAPGFLPGCIPNHVFPGIHSQTSSESFNFIKVSASNHDFTAFPQAAAWDDNAEVLWGTGTVPSPTTDLVSPITGDANARPSQ